MTARCDRRMQQMQRIGQSRRQRCMLTSQVQRATGRAGVAIGLSPLVVIPLYFMYSGAPPSSNVLTRNLISMIICAGMIVFFAGLAHLIRKTNAAYEWI